MLEKQHISPEEGQESTTKHEHTDSHKPYNPESIKKVQQEEQDSLTQEDPDSILDEITDEETTSANKEISEVEPVTNKQITEKTIEVRSKIVEYCKNNKTFQDTGTCTIVINKGTFTIQKWLEGKMSLNIVRPNFKLLLSGNEKDTKKISLTKSGTDFRETPSTIEDKNVLGDARADGKTKGEFTIVDGKCTSETFTDKHAIFPNRPQNALMKNLNSILKGLNNQLASN